MEKLAQPLAVRIVNHVAVYGAWLGGLMLLAVSVLIVFEIILRKGFNLSVGGADEIAGYVLAISSAWAFPYTLLRRSHIRVDVLYTYLPLKMKALLDVLALTGLAIFIGSLAYYSFLVFEDTVTYNSVANTPLRTPLWFPQSLWVAGYIFFMVVIVVLLVTSIIFAVRGRWREVNQLSGIYSIEEEVREEIESQSARLADQNKLQEFVHAADRP